MSIATTRYLLKGNLGLLGIITDEAGRDAARDSILRLADRLGLDNSQRKSYLCLLLEQDRQ